MKRRALPPATNDWAWLALRAVLALQAIVVVATTLAYLPWFQEFLLWLTTRLP